MDMALAVEAHNEAAPWTRIGVARFAVYCGAEDTREVRARDAVGYLETLAAEGYTVLTIRHYRNSANAFLRWLVEEGLAGFDAEALSEAFEAQALVAPSNALAKMEGPEEAEVRRLVQAAYAARPDVPEGTVAGRLRQLVYLRNIAIVETLRATGIRTSELVKLQRCDLDEERQAAEAPDGRVLYFDLESWGAVARYLSARNDPVDCPLLVWRAPVFVRHDSVQVSAELRPLHRRHISRIVQGLRETEGLTARSFRVRFGRSVLEATRDERGTAALLGLGQMKSVRRYGGQ